MTTNKKKYIVRRVMYYGRDVVDYSKVMATYTTYAVSKKQAINNVVYREHLKPITTEHFYDELECEEVG